MSQLVKPSFWLIALCSSVLLITLFFGLKPKGYRFINQVEWQKDSSGIAFTNIGMVYSKKTLGEIGITDSMTILMAVRPYRTGRRLSRIASINDKSGNNLLTIDQWMSDIGVTLWDGKGNQITRTWQSAVFFRDSVTIITTGINRDKLWLYCGQTLIENRSLVGKKYPSLSNGLLLLGMSTTGRNPWNGKLTGCALYTSTLPQDTCTTLISSYHVALLEDTSGSLLQPSAFFTFNNPQGRIITDHSANGWDLVLPRFPKIFHREGVELLPQSINLDRSMAADIIVNFLGFIPFGFCFFLLFQKFELNRKKTLLFTLISALVISIGIEFVQVFIPTRTPQLIDIVLNAGGTWVGAMVTATTNRLN